MQTSHMQKQLPNQMSHKCEYMTYSLLLSGLNNGFCKQKSCSSNPPVITGIFSF